MVKTHPGICPHCPSDDIDPAATRCLHCGGSFGNSTMRQIVVPVILLAAIIAAIDRTSR